MHYTWILILLCASLTQAQAKDRMSSWWRGFCERHLVAEHPYQVSLKTVSNAELINEYRWRAGKFYWYRIASDELHIAYALILDRLNNHSLSEEDELSLRDAIADYPLYRIR